MKQKSHQTGDIFQESTFGVQEVGGFASKTGKQGGKPSKPVFIVSDQEYNIAHSAKLWHYCICNEGFPTKPFYTKHGKSGCLLFQAEELLQGKRLRS